MTTTDKLTDEGLLAALAQRLTERRDALQQAAEVLNEMRVVNAKLESAERLKGRFLSNIRNEINNPLTTLRGFAAAIAGNPHLPREQIVEMAATMQREAGDLSFQMQNIFVAADFEAGSTAPEAARVHLHRLVADIVEDMRVIAAYKQVEITTDIDDGLISLTDPALLGNLVTNLVRNAVEFGRACVQISVVIADEWVTLDVFDDGPGIPVEKAEHIFDRFVQLSEGSTKSHPGHGLGLSVARACAEAIGGSIEVVHSPRPGAHFRVRFPVGHLGASGEDAGASNEFLFDVMETF